eukprot:TRINITY_DN1215_c0_g2_i1.p2 TRINITY_DN1215_c0_g2~~TRINITY_DN1215_c0_g2_i1.p2  ORF type:complete len:124 (-),score=50.26 TRINITY_DN1215_c0_g2_i1:67-438(-)
MEFHFVKLLQKMESKDKFTEADMIQWVNAKVKSAGKTAQIKTFKDLRDGLFLIDLLYAIRPSVVNYKFVTPGKTDEERMNNAKYAITVARKIGCNIFLVWEDIVEGKQKSLFCLIGELMTLDA